MNYFLLLYLFPAHAKALAVGGLLGLGLAMVAVIAVTLWKDRKP